MNPDRTVHNPRPSGPGKLCWRGHDDGTGHSIRQALGTGPCLKCRRILNSIARANKRSGPAPSRASMSAVESSGITHSEPLDPDVRAQSYQRRAVLSRHYGYKLSDEEIASELDISIDTVRAILSSRFAEAWYLGVYRGARLNPHLELARACIAEGIDIADVARVFNARESEVIAALDIRGLLTTPVRRLAVRAGIAAINNQQGRLFATNRGDLQ